MEGDPGAWEWRGRSPHQLASLLLDCPRDQEPPMSGQCPLPAMLTMGPCSRVRAILQGREQIFGPRIEYSRVVVP